MKSVVSLFCGCGGLDIGFKQSGFDLLYACDNDPAAVDCYARNVDRNVVLRDVTSAEFRADIAKLSHCDIVLGGFPCQGFSKAGPKKAEDVRNGLYLKMLEAIHHLLPALFIAENVDGISQNFGGSYIQKIIQDFQAIGYGVEYRLLDAAAFGVPQHRRRIFFVGVRQPAKHQFPWPFTTHAVKTRSGEFKLPETNIEQLPLFNWPGNNHGKSLLPPPITIGEAIAHLIELDDRIPDHQVTHTWPKKYEKIFSAIQPGQKLCNVRHAPTSVYTWEIPEVFHPVTERERIILETISRHRRHKKYGNLPNGNPLSIKQIEQLSGLIDINREILCLIEKNYLKETQEKYDLKGAMFCSGLFKRPLWSEPAPTVLTNFHNPRYFLHPLKNRPFSLRECATLQGFPKSFKFTNSQSQVNLVAGYRLVGNAVPPPLSIKLAAATLQFFQENY
jgi:DNA (cytosine-5)-methyltransferase 1